MPSALTYLDPAGRVVDRPWLDAVPTVGDIINLAGPATPSVSQTITDSPWHPESWEVLDLDFTRAIARVRQVR